ncbi:unnamed protein product [Paramecium octaurelia]|uniref:Uncharacterized protein n=1 Tax=Paramecium octaurelia TaxID=43137 RepID=A0A8S1TT79_PAROT|nr:unnamed protein product [Paramecium octaurelia]
MMPKMYIQSNIYGLTYFELLISYQQEIRPILNITPSFDYQQKYASSIPICNLKLQEQAKINDQKCVTNYLMKWKIKMVSAFYIQLKFHQNCTLLEYAIIWHFNQEKFYKIDEKFKEL